MAQRYHCITSLNITEYCKYILHIVISDYQHRTHELNSADDRLHPWQYQGTQIYDMWERRWWSLVKTSRDAHLMSTTGELGCSREPTLTDPPAWIWSGHDWISSISTLVCTIVGILLQDAKRPYVRGKVPVKSTPTRWLCPVWNAAASLWPWVDYARREPSFTIYRGGRLVRHNLDLHLTSPRSTASESFRYCVIPRSIAASCRFVFLAVF